AGTIPLGLAAAGYLARVRTGDSLAATIPLVPATAGHLDRVRTGDSLAATIPLVPATAGHLDRVRTGDSLALAIALVLATHSQWRWHRRSSSRNDRVRKLEPPAMPIASTPSIPGAGGRRRDGGTAGRRYVGPTSSPRSAFVPHRIGAQDPARIDARSPLH
ncbi:hypothetical protein, partial [Burkholderia multivorans]|uniref:hypothetical protein n=1 Tax=Burkholderia multivorans TaxID=87883 RepID=UPI002870A2D0